MTERITPLISDKLSVGQRQVAATIELLTSGATIPFISRYRKEATGSLDETQVAAIDAEMKRLDALIKRKETILKSIAEQEKLTPELEAKINNCWDTTALEDLYLPYRPKRKTRASIARERGLEPLATLILEQRERNLELRAEQFLTDDVPDVEAALAGARDIIAEWVNEDANARNTVRRIFERSASIGSKVFLSKEEEGAKYRDYFDYNEALKHVPSHRLLAILRAEEEGILRVRIDVEEEQAVERLERQFVKANNACAEQVTLAVKDAWKRLMSPSLEIEFRNKAKEKADEEAIRVFAENLRQLLLAAPLGPRRTLALDPGYRTGCKVACLDEKGDLLHHTTIYPHPPQARVLESAETVQDLVQRFNIQAIAIGNGTASRETDSFIRSALDKNAGVDIFLVSEAGASIYSASEVAREEFPDLDLTVRGAISIGRRLMDPLAELVKIDPKSIGVGQYQHDVDQTKLKESLDQVVISAVNQVGVNLNTASKHLLQYVSGIGPKMAENIILYRKENGVFQARKDLMKVKGLGAKAFEQSAGFLRIPDAANPLDNSAVHPESYHIVTAMAKNLGQSVATLIKNPAAHQQIDIKPYVTEQVGLPTLKDILQELAKPGLDPRGQAEVFAFDDTVRDISDLKPGMQLPGIVTNLAKFGAFVDIGIKENGLIHISQITNRFIKDPAEVLKLGQKVTVRVVEVDAARKRVQLSMKE
ncbi:MAG TPA: Tex family protein [Saprospiraceae bacterium]|nr:Tex family protein [Saprospiraceae bacterium]